MNETVALNMNWLDNQRKLLSLRLGFMYAADFIKIQVAIDSRFFFLFADYEQILWKWNTNIMHLHMRIPKFPADFMKIFHFHLRSTGHWKSLDTLNQHRMEFFFSYWFLRCKNRDGRTLSTSSCLFLTNDSS